MKLLLKILITGLPCLITVLLHGQSEALKIDTKGNVGIGTSSPAEKLQVVGNVKVEGNVNTNGNLDVKNDVKVDGNVQVNKGVRTEGDVQVKGSLKVDGNVQTGTITAKDYALTGAGANGPVPKGGIIMWSGEVTAIPAGWILCDGKNNTPDLADRFVLGAGGKYKKGDKGGQEKVALTVAELPPHKHGFRYGWAEAGGTYWKNIMRNEDLGSSRTTDDCIGCKAQPHENMPPYFALAYIMKL